MSEIPFPDLAWETNLGDAPAVIWRVVSARPYKDRQYRHVESFSTGEAAWKHVDRRISLGEEVLSVTRYTRAD